MIKLFTILSILMFCNISFAHEINIADRTLPRDIRRLEDTFFNQQFKDEPQNERLERLEYRAFGALQNGTDEERVKKLKSAALNYRSLRNVELENEIYPTMQPSFTTRSGWKGVFGSLGNYFNGMPTGMTPQIYYPPNHIYPNSYYRTTDIFSNPGPSIYGNGFNQYFRNNRGEWRYDNRNMGGRTGITILK